MKILDYKYKFALLMLGAAALTACSDDKGNYDYTDLDTVEISLDSDDPDRTGFTIDRGDNLVINPVIYFNGRRVTEGSDAPLDYLWTFYTSHTGLGADYTVDTLSRAMNLDATINRVGGSYVARLTVTNRDTGVEAYLLADCQVEETLTAGWMLLYERADMPGTSDVGLVVNEISKKNLAKNKEFWNLYSSTSGGRPIDGTPVYIYHQMYPMGVGVPRIATSRALVAVNNADFTPLASTADFFFEEAPQSDFTCFLPTVGKPIVNSMTEMLVTADGKCRVLSGDANGLGKFSDPLTSAGATDSEFAPWSSQMCNYSAMQTVVYDKTLSRFCYTVNGSFNLRNFPAQAAEMVAFDVNDLHGAELLFGDYNGFTPAGGPDIMLFADGNSRYIAEAQFHLTPSMPIGKTWTDVSDAPGILQTSAFAVNGLGRYAFYGSGNKVYTLTYDNGRASQVWEAPSADETVTCIATHKYYAGMIATAMMPNINNAVHIATWNESTRQGKLYEMYINPASGAVLPGRPSFEYTVPGKVKSMNWKYEMAM